MRKLNDFEHVNCIRKDMYDLKEDVREGVWDVAKGHGAAQKYDIIPINLSSGFIFMKNSNEVGFKSHIITSLLSRVQKKIISSILRHIDTATDSSHSIIACGSDQEVHYSTSSGTATCYTTKFCASPLCDVYSSTPTIAIGTCKGSGDIGGIPVIDYDNHPNNFYLGACVVWDNRTDPNAVSPRWAYNPNYYAFYNIVAANTKKSNYQIGIWNQNNTTCSDSEVPNRAMIPVSFYDNGKLINGVLIIDTCVLKGEDHRGLTLPEIIYKPHYHKR